MLLNGKPEAAPNNIVSECYLVVRNSAFMGRILDIEPAIYLSIPPQRDGFAVYQMPDVFSARRYILTYQPNAKIKIVR